MVSYWLTAFPYGVIFTDPSDAITHVPVAPLLPLNAIVVDPVYGA